MIILILKNGSETSTLKLTADTIPVGRAKENIIILNDKKVSRMHACIERVGATYQIRDLESGNGTWVNGRKVDFHALSLGDEIRIGDAHLIVKGFEEEEDKEDDSDVLRKTPVPLPQKLQVKDKIAQVMNFNDQPPSQGTPSPPSPPSPGPSPGPA